MRIAFLVDKYIGPRAGTERQIWLLGRELAKRGHEVRLGVLRHSEHTRAGAGDFPGVVDHLDVAKMADPRSFWRVFRWARALRAEGYGLVTVYFNDASVIGPWMLRLAGHRVVVNRRDMGFWYGGRLLGLLRIAGKAVDCMIANSRAAGERACERERIPRSKLEIIYNGIVEPRAVEHPDAGPPARPPGTRRIGVVANVRPVKRVEDLVRAFALLRPRVAGVELAIVGRTTPELQQLVAELGLGECVLMPGQVADAAPWIETFDVGVISSESEGLSNSLLEYMYHGVAVVATATGGNVEVVEPERTGLLVPVGDAPALASALERLLADGDLRRLLGDAARVSVRSRFSGERMVDAHERLFARLLPAGSGTPALERRA